MADPNHTCFNCQFYRGELIGQCRRYPQYVAKHHTEWCGEFRLQSGAEEPKRRGRPPKVAA